MFPRACQPKLSIPKCPDRVERSLLRFTAGCCCQSPAEPQQVADEPITIAALSEAVGVSERTLRNGFTDVYRESPKRYLVTQRLLAARQGFAPGHGRSDGHGDCDRPWFFRTGSVCDPLQSALRGVAIGDPLWAWPGDAVPDRRIARDCFASGLSNYVCGRPAGVSMSWSVPMSTKPRVLLADDHTLWRRHSSGCCLRSTMLSAVWLMDGNCWRQRLESSPTSWCSTSPCAPNGIDAGRQLKEKMRGVKLEFLTMNEDPEVAAEPFASVRRATCSAIGAVRASARYP